MAASGLNRKRKCQTIAKGAFPFTGNAPAIEEQGTFTHHVIDEQFNIADQRVVADDAVRQCGAIHPGGKFQPLRQLDLSAEAAADQRAVRTALPNPTPATAV